MGRLRNIVVVLLAVAYFVYKSPYVDPVAYKSNLPAKLEGALAINEKLDQVERLYENKINWPESFAEYGGKIYTGLGDGRIVHLSTNDVVEIVQMGSKCAGQHEEHICGRPLGMTFSKTGTLYVADAYLGLFSVNVKTGKKVNLVSSNTLVDGKPLSFLNSLTFDAKEEALYITQSTQKWNISHVVTSIVEHESSGRLLKYELKTKKISTVLDNHSFLNGVELSHDKSSLLIASLNTNSILKYHLTGPKKGKTEDFVPTLPGEPDNIKKNKQGNYWVGLAGARSLESPTVLDNVADKPYLRKVLLNLHRMFSTPISFILSQLPSKLANEIALELRSLRIIADIIPTCGGIIEINDQGKVVQALYSPSGQIKHISEAFEHNGYLYIGSWRNHYVGRLKMTGK